MKRRLGNKYAGALLALLLAAAVIPQGCRAEETKVDPLSDVKPFLNTKLDFVHDLSSDGGEELDEEFNLDSQEKVTRNFDDLLKEKATEVPQDFEAGFKTVTEILTKAKDDQGSTESKAEAAPQHASEYKTLSEELRSRKRRKTSEPDDDLKATLKEFVEAAGSDEADAADAFGDKMMHLINAMKRLKKDIIERNMELDNLFLQVEQLRTTVSNADNALYHALLRDLETLSRDLNLLRKGNFYHNLDSDNILNNITVMEAIHGLYVIYRTPFILLRHKFRVYASFEAFVLNLLRHKIPKLLRALGAKAAERLRGLANYLYGNALKLMRTCFIYHNVNRKTAEVYDNMLADFLLAEFKVDVRNFNYAGANALVARAGALMTKLKVRKHLRYLRHCTLGAKQIPARFIMRDPFTGTADMLYIEQKDYKMLEVLYHIYRLKLACLAQRAGLRALRQAALACNLLVKDTSEGVNLYTRPWLKLSEHSLLRLRNLYVLLRSASIQVLERVDRVMEHCFNYANALNPELSILVPRDLSNRIFFVSVVILLTGLMAFGLQLFCQLVLASVNALFAGGAGPRAGLRARLRHWYHRSFLRQLIHVLRRGLATQARPHRRRHRYHRNFESFHRVVEDGDVTNSDNYRQFKPGHRAAANATNV